MAAATRAFVELHEAYALLSDPRRRVAWDAEHHPRTRSSDGPTGPAARTPLDRMFRASSTRKIGDVDVFRINLTARPWRAPTVAGENVNGIWLAVRVGERIPPGVLDHPELYEVCAAGADVRRSDVEQMAASRSLRRIDLSDTLVGDDDVAVLAQMASLEQLRLDGTPITDRSCRALSGCAGLQELSVQETGVTDAGVVALAACKNLHTLDLRATCVEGAGLRALDGLELWRVSVSRDVARADRHHLRAAHPGLRIT